MTSACELIHKLVGRRLSGPVGPPTSLRTMSVHVSSEIGRLNGVIVHSPGNELDAVTPGNRVEYLYDDVIDSEAARNEHHRFVAILERFTPVYHVRQLLAEILTNSEARQLLI